MFFVFTVSQTEEAHRLECMNAMYGPNHAHTCSHTRNHLLDKRCSFNADSIWVTEKTVQQLNGLTEMSQLNITYHGCHFIVCAHMHMYSV